MNTASRLYLEMFRAAGPVKDAPKPEEKKQITRAAIKARPAAYAKKYGI